MQQDNLRKRVVTAFELYLRTGRRAGPSRIEFKFNPWHDPDDGRFTFAGQGNYFPGPDAGQNRHGKRGAGGGSFGGGGATGSWGSGTRNAPNHSLHTVRRGDTLAGIAQQRKGLTASDLAWFNGVPVDRPLRIGQQIKVPHQRFLDEGRDARNKFLALQYYMRTHGGRLPPDPANPPSVESQILDRDWKRISRSGYDYLIDILSRPRKMFGQLSLAVSSKRSRRNQAEAGKPDRRRTDDGGHYIAARFNGPTDAFNHFAQNANFNRGAYRAMEDGWAKELAAKKIVFVEIEPHFVGTSRRPDRILVTWYVNGARRFRNFPNEALGKPHGRR